MRRTGDPRSRIPAIRRHRPAVRGRLARAAAVTVVLVAAAFGSPVVTAAAQDADEDLQVVVRRAELDEGGRTDLIVNVTGPAKPPILPADAFVVVEDGEPVAARSVVPLIGAATVDIVTAVSVDVSRSMEGEPLELVKDAAIDLVETLTSQGIQVGLQTFSTDTDEILPPTTDTAALVAEIEALEAGGRTALFDAVAFGVERLDAVETDAVRSLIVLADGEDNESVLTGEEAIDAARAVDIPVSVLAFETAVLDFDALRPLATETDGRFVMATDAEELAAAFEELATDVASQYVVSYEPTAVGPPELPIEVTVDTGTASASTSFVVTNPRGVDAGTGPQAAELFSAGPLGSPLALYSGVGVAFLALLLLLATVLVPRRDAQVTRTLRSGITMVQQAPAGAPRVTGLSASSIGRRAMEVIEAVPTPPGYDDRLQDDIDRAGWMMRASEFNAIRYGAAVGAGVLLWAVSGRFWLGLVGVVAGAIAPRVVLSSAKRRRKQRFMEHLPDTLQLLSGTLRAGYGVLQGIDTVVRESEPPMSTEFQRVLTEARLGLDLEDSLAAMAERIDDDDFRWVVLAMNIQRRVGGNLAELLDTVAETLRGRDQVRRQVEVLSAEGRLSAVVLIALPFVILGYLLFTNPGYLGVLFTSQLGGLLLGGSALLMIVGGLWMRRLIRIEV
jgi:tight adherence protein B